MATSKIMLTNKDVKFYEDNGYLIVKSIFRPQECQLLAEACLKIADPDFKIKMNPDREIPEARKFINDGRIANIVEALHNNMPMDWLMSQVHFKKPNTPFAKHAWNPHQDNHYTQHPYGMGVSAIVALEDSEPENGGMYLYSGSHKLPLLFHEPHPTFDPNKNPGDKCQIPEKFKDKKVDLYMSKGDLYVQHGNLIHGSYSNNSESKSRMKLGISCIVHGQPYNSKGKNSKRMPQSLRIKID